MRTVNLRLYLKKKTVDGEIGKKSYPEGKLANAAAAAVVVVTVSFLCVCVCC